MGTFTVKVELIVVVLVEENVTLAGLSVTVGLLLLLGETNADNDTVPVKPLLLDSEIVLVPVFP